MAKLYKLAKKSDKLSGSATIFKAALGKDTYDSLHPLGEQAETAYDAKQASKKALADAAAQPVIPLPDEEEIARVARRRAARRSGGRASTVLSDSDSLGG